MLRVTRWQVLKRLSYFQSVLVVRFSKEKRREARTDRVLWNRFVLEALEKEVLQRIKERVGVCAPTLCYF